MNDDLNVCKWLHDKEIQSETLPSFVNLLKCMKKVKSYTRKLIIQDLGIIACEKSLI